MKKKKERSTNTVSLARSRDRNYLVKINPHFLIDSNNTRSFDIIFSSAMYTRTYRNDRGIRHRILPYKREVI